MRALGFEPRQLGWKPSSLAELGYARSCSLRDLNPRPPSEKRKCLTSNYTKGARADSGICTRFLGATVPYLTSWTMPAIRSVENGYPKLSSHFCAGSMRRYEHLKKHFAQFWTVTR